MSGGKFSARDAPGDPVESELISRLCDLPPGPTPDARFKSELRSQLVSITERVIAESAEDFVPARPRRGLLRSIRTPVLSLVGAAAVLVLLLGLAVHMSGGSLPGQSLYGVKRASENVRLSIAGNSTDKGVTYLQFATKRVDEIDKLLDVQPLSGHSESLITDTLGDADADSRDGIRQLGLAVTDQHSAASLAKLAPWAQAQTALLTRTRDRVPAGALRTRVQTSLNLLSQITVRGSQLARTAGCTCLSTAHSDTLGPVPCTSCAGTPARPSGSVPQPSLSLPGLGGSATPTAAAPTTSGR